jgi:hypothetical protein
MKETTYITDKDTGRVERVMWNKIEYMECVVLGECAWEEFNNVQNGHVEVGVCKKIML